MSKHWIDATITKINTYTTAITAVSEFAEDNPECLITFVRGLAQEVAELEDYAENGPCYLTYAHTQHVCGRRICRSS